MKFGQQSAVTTVSVELFRLPRPHSTSKRRLPHNIHNTCKRKIYKIPDKYSFFMFLRMEGGSEEVGERSYSEDELANSVTLAIGEHFDPSTEESGERGVSTENVEDTKCETEEEQQSLVSSSEVGISFNQGIFQTKKDPLRKDIYSDRSRCRLFLPPTREALHQARRNLQVGTVIEDVDKNPFADKFKPPCILTINSIDQDIDINIAIGHQRP